MDANDKLKLVRQALEYDGGLKILRDILRGMLARGTASGLDPLNFEIVPGMSARQLLEMLEDPFREDEVRGFLEKVNLSLSAVEFGGGDTDE